MSRASHDAADEERNREWARWAAEAADQVSTACGRLRRAALLTECRNELQTAFESVQRLEGEVRRGASRASGAGLVIPHMERLRRQMAVFQALVHHLVAYRADLAALVARGRAAGDSPGGRVWIEG